MWCCDNWFPPLPLCFHDKLCSQGWLTWLLDDLILQFLDLFLQSSTPLEILDEYGNSGPHLSGEDYTFCETKTGKRKNVSMLQWWALFWIDRFSFLCWICEVSLRNFHWLPWQLHWASSSHSDARWWEVMHMTATENCSLNAKFRWVHWIQRKRNWAQMQAGSNFPPV